MSLDARKPSDSTAGASATNDHAQHLAANQWSKHDGIVSGETETTTSVPGKDAKQISGASQDQAARDLKNLGFPTMEFAEAKDNAGKSNADSANPSPDTWNYDPQGRLLSAGNRVEAEYDNRGNLTKATIDGNSFERKGNDVVESFKGKDGATYKDTIKNVTNFNLSSMDGQDGSKFKSVDLVAQSANGSGTSEGKVIWESPEAKQSQRDSDAKEAAQKLHNPEPKSWQYDAKGHLLSAGDRVSAQYDGEGKLIRAKIDDITFERKGNDVVETWTGKDGKPFTMVDKGVSKFELTTPDGNYKGKYKSVDLDIKTPNGSGLSSDHVIWESDEYRINKYLDAQKEQEAAAARRGK